MSRFSPDPVLELRDIASRIVGLVASAGAVRSRFTVDNGSPRGGRGAPLTDEQEGCVERFLEEGPRLLVHLLEGEDVLWLQTLGTDDGTIEVRTGWGDWIRVPALRIWVTAIPYRDVYGFHGHAVAELRELARGGWDAHIKVSGAGDQRISGSAMGSTRETQLRIARITVVAAMRALIDDVLAERQAQHLAAQAAPSMLWRAVTHWCSHCAPELYNALCPSRVPLLTGPVEASHVQA